jgi:stearoyl-CoA desaturase (delta-9 desaturase)
MEEFKLARTATTAGAGVPPAQQPALASDRIPARHRIANLIVILAPPAGLIAAVVWIWGVGFGWLHLGLLLGMYILTGLGITIGFHRLFTHRAFETGRITQSVLAILGSMAVEGPLLDWVATHRSHHQHSDQAEDPHSPHSCGAGFLNMTRGLWRAHMGWILVPKSRDVSRYVADFRSNRLLRTISALFPLWVVLSLTIPAALAGLVTMSWTGALLGLIWGGLVRIFFVHHVTWSINSVCHIWGTRPFRSHDESRNNPIFGILAFGEGWHNNHHAFPSSARHGLRWWQIDMSFLAIWLMSRLGLAWNVKIPTPARMAAKRR